MISKYILGFIIFAVIVSVFTIYTLALQWIHKLEETNCKCSEDFKRDYMKYYIYIYFANVAFIIISIIFVTIFSFYNKKGGEKSFNFLKIIYNIIKFIIGILGIINIIFSIMYIYNLKQIDCKCSEDIRREVYYIWNIIGAAIIGINILFIITMFIFGIFLLNKK